MSDPVPGNQSGDLAEQGRRLASEREDLIAQGVNPADLMVPLHPGPVPRNSVGALLAEMRAPTDSESPDAPYNADVWELRRRIDLLTAGYVRIVGLCTDPGGPDSWSHTFDGHFAVFVDDVLGCLEGR